MNNYDTALTKHLVSEFIKEHSRAPTNAELKREVALARRRWPNLDQVGFSGHLIEKPQFATTSSASAESANRKAILTDATLTMDRIEELAALLENSFRGYYASTRAMRAKLNELEARVDNLLLTSGTTDAFVYGVEENFVVQDKVDFDETTASVENGFATIGREGFGPIDLSGVHITYSTTSAKGYIGFQNTSSIESLKADDGSFWEHLVYTSYKQGRVSLIIDMALDTPQFVSEVRFTTSTGGANGRTVATVFHSLDGKTFKAVTPQEVPLVNEENVFNIGLDGVKNIRIMLSKSHYDSSTTLNNQYVYMFSLDSIKLYSSGYVSNAESVLVAGPYEVVDEEGNAVNFTKATADVCMAAGDESAVSLYLSVDGTNFVPVDTSAGGSSTVTFYNSSHSGTTEVLDAAVDAAGITDERIIDMQQAEALLNTAVAEAYVDQVVLRSFVVKRNVPSYDDEGTRGQVYGQDSGWFYDKARKLYRCVVYVSNPAGLGLDLGNTSAFINGIQVSGRVTLQQGYSTFETAESNYQVVTQRLPQLNKLRKADPLYPYNHKYLIEGYEYPDDFRGERVYAGTDEFFGALLEYVPPELFASPENATDLSVYTYDTSDGRGIFKVKVNKSNGDWAAEKYETSWMVMRGGSNQVWFKLVLSSSVAYQSPVVTSVKIRVV